MKLRLWATLVALLPVACNSDGGTPSGPPPPPQMLFTIIAPTEVPTKHLKPVVVRMDVAQSLTYPLSVTLEKANAGQEFFEAGQLSIQNEEQDRVQFQVVIAMDPVLRITVAESEPGGLSVTQTTAIDVLDFEEDHGISGSP